MKPQPKTLISTRINSQLVKSLDELSRGTGRSRSWLIEQCIRLWLGGDRVVGAAGWADPDRRGDDEAADETLARILGVTPAELEAARVAAMNPDHAAEPMKETA